MFGLVDYNKSLRANFWKLSFEAAPVPGNICPLPSNSHTDRTESSEKVLYTLIVGIQILLPPSQVKEPSKNLLCSTPQSDIVKANGCASHQLPFISALQTLSKHFRSVGKKKQHRRLFYHPVRHGIRGLSPTTTVENVTQNVLLSLASVRWKSTMPTNCQKPDKK